MMRKTLLITSLVCRDYVTVDTRTALKRMQTNAGASVEDVSLLLAHHSIKITERHYLKFDQHRQDRLTRAAMVDFELGNTPPPSKQRRASAIQMGGANAVVR
jgi:integrase